MSEQVPSPRKLPSLLFTGFWPADDGRHVGYALPRFTVIASGISVLLLIVVIICGNLFATQAQLQASVTLSLLFLTVLWSCFVYFYSWRKVGYYEVDENAHPVALVREKVRVLTPPISRERFLAIVKARASSEA